jgi:hypothetical protein
MGGGVFSLSSVGGARPRGRPLAMQAAEEGEERQRKGMVMTKQTTIPDTRRNKTGPKTLELEFHSEQ